MNAPNPPRMTRWFSCRLLPLAVIAVTLAACAVPTGGDSQVSDSQASDSQASDSTSNFQTGGEPLSKESGDRASTRSRGKGAAQSSTADKAPRVASSDQMAERTAAQSASERLCDRPTATLSPLSAPDNTPIYEQFNFQPERIRTSNKQVTIDTPYHTFSYCKNTGEWAIANRKASEDPPFNYPQYLLELAEPKYETIEIDGQDYQYRVRLQAAWLSEQINAEQTKKRAPEPLTEEALQPTARESEDSEPAEVVYFDLKLPDGGVTTHQLYTLSEVQNASLGASLGVPSIAGAIKGNNAIWFAATTSQGEGENGFASLLRYDLGTKALDIHQPAEIQGDQITSIVATPAQTSDELTDGESASSTSTFAPTSSASTSSASTSSAPTLWLGTLRSGEGNPFFPASGLVSYQPTSDSSGLLRQYTIRNSPMVGAIPFQLSVSSDELWVATGNGVCQTQWLTIEQDGSWRCWKFTATAAVPSEGVELYPSFLAEKPATQLTDSTVEVLWADWEHFDQPDVDKASAFRYEVVYAPGFEADLVQGGHRLDSKVAQRMARGNDIFWPGQHWHWSGHRFERSLDEVALNLVGGGPHGLIASNIQTGFSFDHYAIRGDFDLLSLEPDGTQVRYYSGWVEGKDLAVYPAIAEVDKLEAANPNPMTSMAADLPPVGP